MTALHHHIDQPKSWVSIEGILIVRGWCFATGAGPVIGVRLLAGNTSATGVIGLPRPDVKAAITSAPHEGVGFEIRAALPGGKTEVKFEAQLADGSWHLLETKIAITKRSVLPKWINGKASILLYAQMPAHARHPPRPLTQERFPKLRNAAVSQPSLSIVTPSFQQARYLRETVQSVLRETRVAAEYVVQDGGSTDGSVEILEQLISPQNQKSAVAAKSPSLIPLRWESVPDRGQADAIARGFAKTSGRPDDLMAWINSDDFYVPGALPFVADYFAAHPEVDAIYGHRILVDENSREIGRWFLPRHDPEVLRLNDFVPQETLFWRRRIWDKVGGVDKSFKFAMDWDLLLRFQAAGARIVRVPYFLACFRIHSAQKTSAAMHDVGQREIDALRARTYGRAFNPVELEQNPRLISYLRRSAWIEFMWNLGLRGR